MDDLYKTNQPPTSFLPTQIITDRPQSYLEQYKIMIQEKLNELINFDQYNEESIKKYIEICYDLSLVCIGKMPNEFFITPEFLNLIGFICQILSQYTNIDIKERGEDAQDIILCNLSLVICILSQNYLVVQEFERCSISSILYKFIQCDENTIVERSIECISYLINGTNDLSLYEPFMDYQILRNLSCRSPEARISVLAFCSSVLNHCDPYFVHRDILIQLGMEIFEFEDGKDFEFLSSLRRLLKICPTPADIFQLFQPEKENSFLYSISEWINPDFYSSTSFHALKLFNTMLRYVEQSRQIIISCITDFQQNIIKICHEKQDDPLVICISYKILNYIIPSHCIIIKQLLDIEEENSFFPIILENLQEGNYTLRKAAIGLSMTIMKWGTIFPQTNVFYSIDFIIIISSILHSDEEKLIISALKSLEMIATKAAYENLTDIINIFHDQNIQEPLESLRIRYENNDTISAFLHQIATTIPMNEES